MTDAIPTSAADKFPSAPGDGGNPRPGWHSSDASSNTAANQPICQRERFACTWPECDCPYPDPNAIPNRVDKYACPGFDPETQACMRQTCECEAADATANRVRYATVVVDPPWPMPATGATSRGETDTKGVYTAKGGRQVDGTWWGRHRGGSVTLPYATMTVAEIASLPVAELAAPAAHLYLWTTNRHLEDAYAVARAWGFRPAQLLTWCKPPMGIGFGGAFTTTTEFVVFARRGSLPHAERQDSSWWQWSRPYENGHIAHSAKPEAFLDLVEQVSPEPRVELFARRNRLGWHTWGDQSLEHVEMPA